MKSSNNFFFFSLFEITKKIINLFLVSYTTQNGRLSKGGEQETGGETCSCLPQMDMEEGRRGGGVGGGGARVPR